MPEPKALVLIRRASDPTVTKRNSLALGVLTDSAHGVGIPATPRADTGLPLTLHSAVAVVPELCQVTTAPRILELLFFWSCSLVTLPSFLDPPPILASLGVEMTTLILWLPGNRLFLGKYVIIWEDKWSRN